MNALKLRLPLTCLSSCLGFFLAAAGDGLYRIKEPTLGCNPIPASENTWRSSAMYARTPVPEAAAESVEADFFQLEYGEPFSFAKGDFFQRHPDVRVKGEYVVKDGALVFSRGISFTFGAVHGEDDIAAIRFGRGWGKFPELHWRLELDVEQSTNVTRWTLNGRTFDIKVPVGKRALVTVPRGLIGSSPCQVGALAFVCKEKKARIRLRSIRIVPYVIRGSWRRTYALDFEPVKAGITIGAHSLCKLIVNGHTLFTGRRDLSGRVEQLDATGILHKGDNTIVYIANYGGGYGRSHDLIFEGFAVAPDGSVKHLLSDTRWEQRWGTNAWTNVLCFNRVGLERMPGGMEIATGLQPMHAGALLAMPVERAGYPVFDIDEKATWRLSWPKSIGEATVTAVVTNALTGEAVCRRTVKDSAGVVEVTFTGLKTGAYEVRWTLQVGTRVIDRLASEMLIAGPVEQDVFAYRDFDAALAKRLKRLQAVDCAKDDLNVTNYIAQRSPHWRRHDDVAGVHHELTTGLTYRETGSGNGDWFSYKLDVKNPGRAHILEVEFPDTHEQTLYVSINEGYPVTFCNNGWPIGERGWPNATGAVRCGGVVPLSGGTRKVQVVFFPGTKGVAAVFSNGGPGRAGVCGFTLYEVEGGLPALEIPKTERLYANHNERFLFAPWGTAVTPRIQEADRSFTRCWAAAYAAIANRIAFLRYCGHNAAVEGSYMYSGGFPTLSGESSTAFPEWDFYYAIVKLYRRNGIKLFVGYEYMHSPKLLAEGACDCSDREVWAAGKRPIHTVDRYGKQVMGYQGMGLNYMNSRVWRSMTNVVSEIYARYAPVGDIAGLWVIDGGWWLPGYPTSSGRVGKDVGYDDDAIEQFERCVGISLGTGFVGRERFQRRYELLNGRYSNEWYAWRSKRLREALETMQDVISSGPVKWSLFAVPDVRYPEKHPFNAADATPLQRERFHAEVMRCAGFDPSDWGEGSGARVQLVPKVDFERQWSYPRYESMVNSGTINLYRRNDALYFSPEGLNERPIRMRDEDRDWWFRRDGITVYDVKPAGHAAFCDLVDVFAAYMPKRVFHSWLDVNCTTAHADECRRLLTGFYATPCVDFVPFEGVKGVEGWIGDGCVLLVNDTPWPVTGSLTARSFEAWDAFIGLFKGVQSYTLPPFGVTCVRMKGSAELFRAEFHFDGEITRKVLDRADKALSDRFLAQMLPPDRLVKLESAYRARDVYRLAVLFRDWEIRRVVEPFERADCLAIGTPIKTLMDLNPPKPIAFSATGSSAMSPLDPAYRSADGHSQRTVSMLIRCTGMSGAVLFGNDQLRFDVTFDKDGGLMAFTGFPEGSDWFTVGLPRTQRFSVGTWHHLCWTADPLGSVTLWVDGIMRQAGSAREFATGQIHRHGSRLHANCKFEGNGRLEVGRLVVREGVLSAAEIRAESEKWLK